MIQFVIFTLLLDLLLITCCPVCGKSYVANYARFGDPIGSDPIDRYSDTYQNQKPYYDKENLNKYTYDDMPFGIGGALSIAGAAWEGGTRIGKGLIGMGDVTDENPSLGVRNYGSLSADDFYEDDYQPRHHSRLRRLIHYRRQPWRRNRWQRRRLDLSF